VKEAMALNWFKKNKDKSEHKIPVESHSQEDSDTAVDSQLDATEEISDPLPSDPPPSSESDVSDSDASGGYIGRLKNRLTKTRQSLADGMNKIFTGGRAIDDEVMEDLEELLITADIGVQTAMELIGRISSSKISDAEQIKQHLCTEILSILNTTTPAAKVISRSPHIVMVVGVNGVGKTTTIGKLAAKATASSNSVLIAAADTFRAAAVEQLMIWAERADADLVKHKEHADPAAVAYDAVAAAVARGTDIVLIDTAGRLHTKVNLMEELKKIKRSIAKQIPDAPHEILLVLDATTGQNAISQAKLFNDALGVTGLALTKLDGTAKGGIVVSICSTLNIPLQYIGIGEQIEDLREFEPEQFVKALF
jgi:fused signal recognition particle receptor